MKTQKLYYEDCHLREFSATVTGCVQTQEGYLVTLDATAFYPEGGGQACDLGKLGNANVLDVREDGEEVLHLCDGPLEVGQQVCGCIDWGRRFDQMQQHSGEHILSGLIHKTFGYHNVGFHVGKEAMEVDFDGPISWEELCRLEQLANEAVWRNLPVQWNYPAPEELEKIPYRSKKELPWPVRIVTVPGYDTCACCGVHVAQTGEIGIIKVLSCVKFHQGVRIEMLCGKRAFDYLSAVYEQNRQVSQLFSAKRLETGAAAKQMSEQLTAEKYRSAGLEKQLFRGIAESYVNQGDVLHFEQTLSAAAVRELADAIAEFCDGVAAVFSGSDESGYSVCMICKNGDVRELGKAMNEKLNGRGGGKPGSFQGSVKATRKQIEEFFNNR
ncbi:MAG: alanyl-tRNA editing protein [Oscillospiraceae bacterium]|nr:alanyl-tRNA editing protein [Oscillospiraceae bacterium]